MNPLFRPAWPVLGFAALALALSAGCGSSKDLADKIDVLQKQVSDLSKKNDDLTEQLRKAGGAAVTPEQLREAVKPLEARRVADLKAEILKEHKEQSEKTETELKQLKAALAADLDARPTKKYVDDLLKARPPEKAPPEALAKMETRLTALEKRPAPADAEAAVKKIVEAELKARPADKALADAVKKLQDDVAAGAKGRVTQAELGAAVKAALEAESKSRPTEKTALDAIRKVDELTAEVQKRLTLPEVQGLVKKAVDAKPAEKGVPEAIKKLQDDLAASSKGRLTQADVDAAVKKALTDVTAGLEKRPTKEQLDAAFKAVDTAINNRVAAALDGEGFRKAVELRVKAGLPKAVTLPGLLARDGNFHRWSYDVTAGSLAGVEAVPVTFQAPSAGMSKVFAASAKPSADGKSLLVEAWTTAPWDGVGTGTLSVWLPAGVKVADKPKPGGTTFMPLKFGK